MPIFLPLPQGICGRNPSVMLATVFGIGRFRWAPGTAGSLVTLPLAFILSGPFPLLAGALIAFVLGMIAIPAMEKAEHDSGMVVIDEVSGQLIAMAAMRPGNLPDLALAFILFRLFDVTKPWPACYFDRKVPGAFGVMMDDVVAGIMGALVLLGIHTAGIMP
ncbi:MAG TPA: phosphatidylglycerophosphatase A [Rhodospirillaceae bacterium]|nr:MAG: hypothetical protein A2018_04180 [Alphaproteobacteria bacterium GWF2_58_20]HAU28719.1 phosphatidylglycerophosphatase A [Rhodospirillaceae bacterium]